MVYWRGRRGIGSGGYRRRKGIGGIGASGGRGRESDWKFDLNESRERFLSE